MIDENKDITQTSQWFQKLPGFKESPSGLERKILRMLPQVLLVGTILPICLAIFCHLSSPDQMTAAEERSLMMSNYMLAGIVSLHWTIVLIIAILCTIVMIMKGPAYAADAYSLNDSDKPRKHHEDHSSP